MTNENNLCIPIYLNKFIHYFFARYMVYAFTTLTKGILNRECICLVPCAALPM